MTDGFIKNKKIIELEVRRLYGGKISGTNALGSERFLKTLKNKKRVIDLFHLPPSRSSLKLRKSPITLSFDNDLITYT